MKPHYSSQNLFKEMGILSSSVFSPEEFLHAQQKVPKRFLLAASRGLSVKVFGLFWLTPEKFWLDHLFFLKFSMLSIFANLSKLFV